MKNNKTYIALAGVIALGAVALIFSYPDISSAPTNVVQQTVNQNTPQTETVSLTVQGLYAGKSIGINTNETMLQLLRALDAQDSQVQLVTREYAGMGTLVTGMHGNVNGVGKKYWQYKVNGIMPQIGAGAYVLKNRDKVEWFFDASQE